MTFRGPAGSGYLPLPAPFLPPSCDQQQLYVLLASVLRAAPRRRCVTAPVSVAPACVTALSPWDRVSLCLSPWDRVSGSGSIDIQELDGMMQALGVPLPESELKAVFQRIDVSGFGSIRFEDFSR